VKKNEVEEENDMPRAATPSISKGSNMYARAHQHICTFNSSFNNPNNP
jgi:hypothetical protein